MNTILQSRNPHTRTILKIVRYISKQPKTYPDLPRAYLVGGYVRDFLLGMTPKDIDMEVYGISYPNLYTLLTTLFPNRISEVAKKFGVLRIAFPKYTIDVALPRTEKKTGHGYFGFEVTVNPNLSFKEASSRRDFTLNAILLDPLTGRLLDPYKGQKDLEKKILRAVNLKTFPEDPLRVYRAIQFVARFKLKVESKTLAAMKQMVKSGELETLSKKRITTELDKLKKSKYPETGLALAAKLGVNI